MNGSRPGEKRDRVPTEREGGARGPEVSGVLDAVEREYAGRVGGAERGRAVEIRRGELSGGVDSIDGSGPRHTRTCSGARTTRRAGTPRGTGASSARNIAFTSGGSRRRGAVDLLEETRAGDDDGAGLHSVGAILDELREVLHRDVVRAGDALGVAARRARARARAAAVRALRSRRDDRGPRRARVRRAGSPDVASTAADAPSGGSAGRDAPRSARVRRARRASDGVAPGKHALRHHSEPHPSRSRARVPRSATSERSHDKST